MIYNFLRILHLSRFATLYLVFTGSLKIDLKGNVRKLRINHKISYFLVYWSPQNAPFRQNVQNSIKCLEKLTFCIDLRLLRRKTDNSYGRRGKNLEKLVHLAFQKKKTHLPIFSAKSLRKLYVYFLVWFGEKVDFSIEKQIFGLFQTSECSKYYKNAILYGFRHVSGVLEVESCFLIGKQLYSLLYSNWGWNL